MKSRFLLGVRDATPVMIGYLPVAVAFGLIAADTGLLPLEAIAMSMIVFAGAAQFVAVGMIQAGAAGIEIVLAVFLLNLRHILMSASLAQKKIIPSRLVSILTSFGITDEVFVVASGYGESAGARRQTGLELGAWSAWVGGTTLGILGGDVLPLRVQAAFGISIYALFVCLLASRIGKDHTVLWCAVLSGIANTLGVIIFKLPAGTSMVIAMFIGAGIGAALPIPETEHA
jgi:4-azaleucine resistance transporter AzlC